MAVEDLLTSDMVKEALDATFTEKARPTKNNLAGLKRLATKMASKSGMEGEDGNYLLDVYQALKERDYRSAGNILKMADSAVADNLDPYITREVWAKMGYKLFDSADETDVKTPLGFVTVHSDSALKSLAIISKKLKARIAKAKKDNTWRTATDEFPTLAARLKEMEDYV